MSAADKNASNKFCRSLRTSLSNQLWLWQRASRPLIRLFAWARVSRCCQWVIIFVTLWKDTPSSRSEPFEHPITAHRIKLLISIAHRVVHQHGGRRDCLVIVMQNENVLYYSSAFSSALRDGPDSKWPPVHEVYRSVMLRIVPPLVVPPGHVYTAATDGPPRTIHGAANGPPRTVCGAASCPLFP